MNWIIKTNNTGVDVKITLHAKNPCEIRTYVSCSDSDVLFNLRNEQLPAGKSVVFMKIPFSPQNTIVNIEGSIPNNLQIKVERLPCKSYKIPMGATQIEFMEFCQAFAWSVMNGKIKPSDEVYKSSEGNFKMVLMPRITDHYGRAIDSPASVDGDQKIIILDYALITQFTVAGMIALLCHEYAHVFANEREGYPKESEEGADKFGLRLFLAAGYGESEYINALRQTFKRVDTNQNRRRLALIIEQAQDINKGKIYGKPY